jgi:hypothetical protein
VLWEFWGGKIREGGSSIELMSGMCASKDATIRGMSVRCASTDAMLKECGGGCAVIVELSGGGGAVVRDLQEEVQWVSERGEEIEV